MLLISHLESNNRATFTQLKRYSINNNEYFYNYAAARKTVFKSGRRVNIGCLVSIAFTTQYRKVSTIK